MYCNQVFVTDSVEGIVPEFLTLLHGVIDSPDIPLNVSRSYLQSDSNVKKISSHITKKVADRLNNIFKNNREEFEKNGTSKLFHRVWNDTDDNSTKNHQIPPAEDTEVNISHLKNMKPWLRKTRPTGIKFLFTCIQQTRQISILISTRQNQKVMMCFCLMASLICIWSIWWRQN